MHFIPQLPREQSTVAELALVKDSFPATSMLATLLELQDLDLRIFVICVL